MDGNTIGRPDSIDWHRAVGGAVAILPKGSFREIQVPGSYWEYNDVRINALCAALTILFQEPLPVVLDRNLMRPLGASQTWTWNGFQRERYRLARSQNFNLFLAGFTLGWRDAGKRD